MNHKKTFANASTFENYKKTTKRKKYLAEMELVVSKKELHVLLGLFYPNPKKVVPR